MDFKIDSIPFENVMEENGEYLIRLAFMYVKNWSTSEDIVQEVFVTYYQKFYQFENKSSIKTYLAKITINKCHDYLRSWKNRILPYSSMFFGNSITSKNSPEQVLVEKESTSLLIQEISNMSIKYRDVLLLYYYQDFRIQEIGEILNCSENTVKTRLLRAKAILRNKLDENKWGDDLDE